MSYAADIENFDKPKRDRLIQEILTLLEVPSGGATLTAYVCPACPPCPGDPCVDAKVGPASASTNIKATVNQTPTVVPVTATVSTPALVAATPNISSTPSAVLDVPVVETAASPVNVPADNVTPVLDSRVKSLNTNADGEDVSVGDTVDSPVEPTDNGTPVVDSGVMTPNPYADVVVGATLPKDRAASINATLQNYLNETPKVAPNKADYIPISKASIKHDEFPKTIDAPKVIVPTTAPSNVVSQALDSVSQEQVKTKTLVPSTVKPTSVPNGCVNDCVERKLKSLKRKSTPAKNDCVENCIDRKLAAGPVVAVPTKVAAQPAAIAANIDSKEFVPISKSSIKHDAFPKASIAAQPAVNMAAPVKSANIGTEQMASIPAQGTVTKINTLPTAASARSIKISDDRITAQAPGIIVQANAPNAAYVPNISDDIYTDDDATIANTGDNEKPLTLAEALAKERKRASKRNKTKISGELYSSIGLYTDGRLQFNRANADLNERNYRILSDQALNNRQNTYDPALYSRMKFVVDSSVGTAVAAHINVTLDPWSLTGKSKEILVQQGSGDIVKLQYLSIGSNTYTVGRILRTKRTGDALALPETKIDNGNIIEAMRVGTTFGGFFNLPEQKLEYTFMPIRELWLDYKPTDSVFLRAFPLAYENQALTTDDPLTLSNNRSYWEESPWLRSWEPGNFNDLAGSFTKGYWDRSLSFGTRDSTGQRLTGLRGLKFAFTPEPDTTLDLVVASPKTLWQDYGDFDTLASSARLKHYFDEGLYVGATAATHQGFVKSNRDAHNHVGSVDTGIMPFENVKFNAQYAFSSSRYDETDTRWRTKDDGKAYYASLIATSDPYMMNKKDYYGIASGAKENDFYKTRIYIGRMDQQFESSLSNYHSTRKDAFWNRHLTFYPSIYRYLPGVAQMAYSSEDDLTPYAIGDGLDYGRMAYGWRGDVGFLDGALKGLADVRQVVNVNARNRKKIETVAQTHWGYKVNDRLTTKALFIADQKPLTTAGIDPNVYDGTTGEYLQNAAVIAGEDPSTTTTAVGARYKLTEWAALNGVWEYTNDSTLATDNFPNANLNSSFITTFRDETRLYTKQVPFVYSGGLFDQPPYDYFSIMKTGLELIPMERWHIYLDYTRNSNVFAGNIDDNMNHFGIESTYLFTKNWGIFGRYSYTRWNDFVDLGQASPFANYRGYHNVHFATRWVFAPDSWLGLEYGVGPAYNVATNVYDPRLAYYSSTVLDTQHIIRMTLLKKF
jgi:hypothetical protein